MTDFDRFWQAYPRRVGRKRAEEAFKKAMTRTTIDVILQALEWQRQQPQWLRDGGTYIPYPQGWLNQERWTDEAYIPPEDPPPVSEKTMRNLEAIYGDSRRDQRRVS